METAKKRTRFEKGPTPREEKEPKLKCHKMRLIFQRLPTSELIRFISNQPKHPLGKFWSQELKFVVEKRLPFSYKATATPRGTVSDHVIFDCNGSHVAEIKRPTQFRMSPICELIQSAQVPAIALNASYLPAQFVFPIPNILSTLTSLDTLVLSIDEVIRHSLRDPVDLPAALNSAVMSRIKSLTLTDHYYYCHSKQPLLEIINRATSLKKLCVPYVDLSSRCLLAALPHGLPGHSSSLDSLSIKDLDAQSVQPLLETITTRFNGLRELFLPVRAPMRQYLAAFRALPSLSTLGLETRIFGLDEAEKQLSVDENDLPVVSVTEFLIACLSLDGKATRALLATLSQFPNVRTLGADFRCQLGCRGCVRHPESVLHFASAVCAGGVFMHLQSLKLFSACANHSLPTDALLQFIRANIDCLPNSVDLSQVLTAKPRTVDRDFLVDLYAALQRGRVTSLALKDLIHREAVSHLRKRFALANVNGSKVLAWIDEESIVERRSQSREWWWPGAVADFTDFRIEACKTAGPLKGSTFKVRIANWTEKRKGVFDHSPV